MELLGTSYASPEFERAAAQANSWKGKFVFSETSETYMLNRCETAPGLRALAGVSVLEAHRKL